MTQYMRSKLLATAFPATLGVNDLLPRLLFAAIAVVILG